MKLQQAAHGWSMDGDWCHEDNGTLRFSFFAGFYNYIFLFVFDTQVINKLQEQVIVSSQ